MRKLIFVIAMLLPSTGIAAVWSAKVSVDKSRTEGAEALVCFSASILRDGAFHHPFEKCVRPASVESEIIRHLRDYHEGESLDTTKLETVTYVPPVPVTPPVPDPARDKFRSDYLSYIGLLNAVKAGIILQTDPAIANLLATLQKEWLPAYAPLIAGIVVP